MKPDPHDVLRQAKAADAEAERLLRWLTPAQVGRMVGFSATFIRLEIKAGALRAVQAGRGSRVKRWKIAEPEAKRYRQQMMGGTT